MKPVGEPTAEAAADRTQQKELLTALDAFDRALRRDECGAWTIRSTRGTIHTWGDGRTWALYVACRSAQHWTWTKKRLAFCKVTQDGDDEGVLRLQRLPTPHEAEAIRDILGVRKRMVHPPNVAPPSRQSKATNEDQQQWTASVRKARLSQGLVKVLGNTTSG